jgi:hypothetical protein
VADEYRIPLGAVGIHDVTLTPSIEARFLFEDDDVPAVVIATDGEDRIFYTLDGEPATVAGQNCGIILAAMGYHDALEPPTSGPTLVRMISPGAPTVSVCRDV